MNKFFTTLLTLAAVSIALPAGLADHCSGPGQSDAEITTDGSEGAIHYVDNDACQPDCGFSIWIYEESNGIDGLQRSYTDEGDNEFMVDTTCHGMVAADTIVF